MYEAVRGQAIITIEEALQPGPNASSGGISYVNALQQIESLRLICNLGLSYRSGHDGAAQRPKDDWISIAQRIFNTRRELDPISCLHCSSIIGLAESLFDSSDSKREGQFFRCLKFCCGECVEKARRSTHDVGCGHRPSCLGTTVSLVGKAIEEAGSLEPTRMQGNLTLPSKIQALVTDIKALPEATKWYNSRPPLALLILAT